MKQADIFYPHKTLESSISMNIKCNNAENVPRYGNTFNFFDCEIKKNISLSISAQIPMIETVVSEKNHNKCNELLDVCLLIKSNKSAFRGKQLMQKKGSIYFTKLDIDLKDWAGEINLSSALILKKNDDDEFGFAAEKGTLLGWSPEYKLLLEEPEQKKGKDGIDVSWISFSDPKMHWLNDNYPDDIYALDLHEGKKMPKLYLNKDMNLHLKNVLINPSKKTSYKTVSRDLMFQTITTGILSQLITSALIEFKNTVDEQNLDENNNDPNNIANTAWEEMTDWKRNILENYAPSILPEARKKDAVEELKLKLCEDERFHKELLRKVLNISQNAMPQPTREVFTKCSEMLTKKN
jgi:hypothetical protein